MRKSQETKGKGVYLCGKENEWVLLADLGAVRSKLKGECPFLCGKEE